MMLPLIALDIETTGTDTKESRIVQIAFKLVTDGEPWSYKTLVNPTIPIPEAASKVHGITDEQVKDAPTFGVIADKVLKVITGRDLLTYNGNRFDLPLIYNELKRCGRVWDWKRSNFIDASNIFKIKESRTLAKAFLFFTGQELTEAHDALADVEATEAVFRGELERYEELKSMDRKQLAHFSNYDRVILDITGSFTRNEEGIIIFNFGKHKGEPAHLYPSYLDYMLRGTFEPEAKEIATNIRYKGWK